MIDCALLHGHFQRASKLCCSPRPLFSAKLLNLVVKLIWPWFESQIYNFWKNKGVLYVGFHFCIRPLWCAFPVFKHTNVVLILTFLIPRPGKLFFNILILGLLLTSIHPKLVSLSPLSFFNVNGNTLIHIYYTLIL